MRAGDGFDTALGEEAVLGRVDGLGIGRNRRDPLHAGLLAAKMLWVAVVAGTPAIRRISSCTVRVGECSAAYKEASFAGSTRHDIHQVSVEYLARIIRRIIELEGPIHQDEIVIRWTRRLSEGSAAQSVIGNAVEPFEFDTESPENSLSRSIPLDFTAKASVAVCVDGLLFGRRPPGLPSAGLVVV